MSLELKKAIDDLGTAFAEFKSTNEERLQKLQKGQSVTELDQKLAKLSDRLSDLDQIKADIEALQAKANRPGAGKNEDPVKAEHKQAFGKFLRKGNDDGLLDLERKAYNVTTDADGGYAVPEELDRDILSLMKDVSPIRSIATVRTISTADYKKLVNIRGTTSGWVDEDDPRTATSSSQLAAVMPFMGEIYAFPQATQQMLDDVFFNAESWLTDEVSVDFAQKEGAAFITGDGTKKPKGFCAYTTAATPDSSRAFGTLEHIATGVSNDWPASEKENKLIDLIYAVKQGYRANARFVIGRPMLGEIRKFRDTEGNLLWQPGLQAGQPSQLLGYPVTEAEDMPVKAANSLSVAFGDFKRGYLIVDRIGTRVLRDPFTNKPYVGFYVTKRLGGCVVDSQAIKFLKFAAA
jgi:HK97 family phage major capsid protein